MLPDITDKRFVILGLQGSGKSVLVDYILRNFRNHIVYDVHREHTGFNRYLVENKRVKDAANDNDPAIVELNTFVERIVQGTGIVRLFMLEEANRYCPNKKPLPSSILVLNDDQRHSRIAFGTVARRMAQLNTDLTELAHYLFIFRLTGKNDIDRLEAEAEGLGEAVKGLKDFHFVIVNQDRTFEIHKPVPFIKPEKPQESGQEAIGQA